MAFFEKYTNARPAGDGRLCELVCKRDTRTVKIKKSAPYGTPAKSIPYCCDTIFFT